MEGEGWKERDRRRGIEKEKGWEEKANWKTAAKSLPLLHRDFAERGADCAPEYTINTIRSRTARISH